MEGEVGSCETGKSKPVEELLEGVTGHVSGSSKLLVDDSVGVVMALVEKSVGGKKFSMKGWLIQSPTELVWYGERPACSVCMADRLDAGALVVMSLYCCCGPENEKLRKDRISIDSPADFLQNKGSRKRSRKENKKSTQKS
jgi:hypothetical protein